MPASLRAHAMIPTCTCYDDSIEEGDKPCLLDRFDALLVLALLFL